MSDPSTLRVLAVGAHPDDLELNCAGTLARYAAQGHKVFIAPFTSGNMGDTAIPPKELATIRRRESEAAAAVIEATLLWPGVDDELVFPDPAQRSLMIDLLREADPDVVFTHSPNDYHPDHRYVSQLVFDSYFQKGLPHVPGPVRPACRFGQTQVYYIDNLGGIGFLPAEYVDITPAMEAKKRMLASHESQFRAMRELAGDDLMDLMLTQVRFRGLAAGCRYAEGFCRLDAYQRGLTRCVLP